MRILLATYWYLPHVGGVNTYINVLRKELMKAGHQVDVLAHHPRMNKIYMLTDGRTIDKPKIKEIVNGKVRNFYQKAMPFVPSKVRQRESERYTFEVAAACFDLGQYDLIHTQDVISTRALSRVKPAHVPLVATIHGLLAPEQILGRKIPSKRALLWQYAATEEYLGAVSADQTIVPTRWLKNVLTGEPFGVPENKLTIVGYGMDIETFLDQHHSVTTGYIPFVDKWKTVLLCPARLVPVKGQRYLLQALARLLRKRNDFVCWLAGEGKLRRKLESMAYALGIGNLVHFLGNRDDIPYLMKHADIVVLPSVQDNHPFVIMEAQVAGKVVVASDAGGVPELVRDGETGLLFPRKNSAALASKLDFILSRPDLMERIARQGQEWGMQQWSAQNFLEKTMDVYHKALQEKR